MKQEFLIRKKLDFLLTSKGIDGAKMADESARIYRCLIEHLRPLRSNHSWTQIPNASSWKLIHLHFCTTQGDRNFFLPHILKEKITNIWNDPQIQCRYEIYSFDHIFKWTSAIYILNKPLLILIQGSHALKTRLIFCRTLPLLIA